MKQNREIAIIILGSVLIIWTVNWWFMKVALQFIDPYWFSTLRLIISTIILFIILIFSKELTWPKIGDIPALLAVGVCQIGIYMMLAIIALDQQGASRTVIICGSSLIWTAPIAIIYFKELNNIVKTTGLVIVFAGILFYFNPFEFEWSNISLREGSIIAFFSTIFMSIGILFSKYGKTTTSGTKLYVWNLFIASIVAIIISTLVHPKMQIIWDYKFLFALSFSSIFATLFGWWGIIYACKILDASFISCSLLTVPVFTVILSHFELKETLNTNIVLSLICIVSGTALTIYNKQIREFIKIGSKK